MVLSKTPDMGDVEKTEDSITRKLEMRTSELDEKSQSSWVQSTRESQNASLDMQPKRKHVKGLHRVLKNTWAAFFGTPIGASDSLDTTRDAKREYRDDVFAQLRFLWESKKILNVIDHQYYIKYVKKGYVFSEGIVKKFEAYKKNDRIIHWNHMHSFSNTQWDSDTNDIYIRELHREWIRSSDMSHILLEPARKFATKREQEYYANKKLFIKYTSMWCKDFNNPIYNTIPSHVLRNIVKRTSLIGNPIDLQEHFTESVENKNTTIASIYNLVESAKTYLYISHNMDVYEYMTWNRVKSLLVETNKRYFMYVFLHERDREKYICVALHEQNSLDGEGTAVDEYGKIRRVVTHMETCLYKRMFEKLVSEGSVTNAADFFIDISKTLESRDRVIFYRYCISTLVKYLVTDTISVDHNDIVILAPYLILMIEQTMFYGIENTRLEDIFDKLQSIIFDTLINWSKRGVIPSVKWKNWVGQFDSLVSLFKGPSALKRLQEISTWNRQAPIENTAPYLYSLLALEDPYLSGLFYVRVYTKLNRNGYSVEKKTRTLVEKKQEFDPKTNLWRVLDQICCYELPIEKSLANRILSLMPFTDDVKRCTCIRKILYPSLGNCVNNDVLSKLQVEIVEKFLVE
jgi:hypothetical protein